VIFGQMRWHKAIPALTVGIAFFLMGCHPRVPSKGEVRVEESALSLQRMGEAYLRIGKYEKALGFFERIPERYSNYSELSYVRYEIVRALYLLKEYDRSKGEALKWLERYPRDTLRSDVMDIIGRDFEALDDNPRAFVWWVKAKEECREGSQRQAEITKRLEALAEEIDISEIERLETSDLEGNYAPQVYYTMATIFLGRNEPERAEKAAMLLLQSTSDGSWVSLGEGLLKKIKEEISVGKGVIGCLLPLSGPFAIYGEEVLNGIQLGAGVFGERGQGPNLELVIRDTKGDPDTALSGLEDLVDNANVSAIIGPLSSRTAVPVAKKAQELGVPIIAITQKKGVTEQGDMVFRNFLMPSQEVNRLVDTTISRFGIKRFCILYPDNSYGRFFMNLFWDRVEEMGGMVTCVESYRPDQTDFADQINKAVGLYYRRPDSLVKKLEEMRTPEEEEDELEPDKPEPIIDFDAIFLPDNFQRVAMIAPQLVYHDVLYVQLMGTSLWQSPQLIKLAGDYVQSAMFPSGFFRGASGPGVRSFVEDYRKNFDSYPGVLAANGYDTVRVLSRVISRGKVRTRKDVQKALLECHDFIGVTGKISFDENGEVQKEPLLLTISRNKITLFQ